MKRLTAALTVLVLYSPLVTAQPFFQGLTPSPLGQASLAWNDTMMVVSNIGSSGLDGVMVEPGAAEYLRLELAWPTEIPSGAYATIEGVAQGASQPASSLSFHFDPLAGTTLTYQDIGANYTVAIFNDTMLVAELVDLRGPVIAEIAGPPADPTVDVFRDGRLFGDVYGTSVGFGEERDIILPEAGGRGGMTARGNRISISATDVVASPLLERARIRAGGRLSGFRVTDLTVGKFGVPNDALGQAGLAWNDTMMVVSNIGSSGLDGVRASLPEGSSSTHVTLRPLALDEGERVHWYTNVGDEVPIAGATFSFQVEGLGNRRIGLAAFCPDSLAWSLWDFQVVRNGQVLLERTLGDGEVLVGRNFRLVGFGRAAEETDGWAGFFVEVQRGAQTFQLRYVPAGVNLAAAPSDFMSLRATRGAFGTLGPVFITGITTTGGRSAAAAESRRAGQSGPPSAASSVVLSSFALHAAYPNPFNPATTLRFDVPEASDVTIEVLDLRGRRVALLADGHREAGTHTLRFDASALPSGTYLVRMQSDTATQVQRVTLLK